MSVLSNGTYLLYDDDCGVCTTFSHFFKRLLGNRVALVPMHIPQIEKEGMKKIPSSYWTSFHIVKNGKWTTEGSAIIALASLFPMGSVLRRVATFPPIFSFLKFFLSQMQQQRQVECSFEY